MEDEKGEVGSSYLVNSDSGQFWVAFVLGQRLEGRRFLFSPQIDEPSK
jgi:hypothetical protein